MADGKIGHHSAATLEVDGSSLTVDSFARFIGQPLTKLALPKRTILGIDRSAKALDKLLVDGHVCYGVNTGFGDLQDTRVADESAKDLQRRLIYSHSVGNLLPLSEECARGTMLCRLNVLAKGLSGVRPKTVQRIVDFYNFGVVPYIHADASLGASGDLGPLSQFASFFIGKGKAWHRGKIVDSLDVHKTYSLSPLVLDRKEGLSLINGTSASLAVAIVALLEISMALNVGLLAMSLLLAIHKIPLGFLEPAGLRERPHDGALRIGSLLHNILEAGANPNTSSPHGIQGVYSFRCAPYILGPLLDSLTSSRKVFGVELNAANDNPLVLLEPTLGPYHGGHFHGHPIAVSLDQVRIAAVHLSGVLDRQIEFVLDKRRNAEFPPFLSVDPTQGHCGLEGLQYLASSRHIDNKFLCQSVSEKGVQANAGNQDYTSQSLHSALRTLELAENTWAVVAAYLFVTAQSISLSGSDSLSGPLGRVGKALTDIAGTPYRDDQPISEYVELFLEKQTIRSFVEFAENEIPGYFSIGTKYE